MVTTWLQNLPVTIKKGQKNLVHTIQHKRHSITNETYTYKTKNHTQGLPKQFNYYDSVKDVVTQNIIKSSNTA